MKKTMTLEKMLLSKLKPSAKVLASTSNSLCTRLHNKMGKWNASLPHCSEGSARCWTWSGSLRSRLWVEYMDTATKVENLVAKISQNPPFQLFFKPTPHISTLSMFLARSASQMMLRSFAVNSPIAVSIACSLAMLMIMLEIPTKWLTCKPNAFDDCMT